MSKLKIIKKIIKTPCYCCNEGLYGKATPRKNCSVCKGTGKYREYHYTIIYNKQAFDMDTIK